MEKCLPLQIVILPFPWPYKIIFLKDKSGDQYLNPQNLQAFVEQKSDMEQ